MFFCFAKLEQFQHFNATTAVPQEPTKYNSNNPASFEVIIL